MTMTHSGDGAAQAAANTEALIARRRQLLGPAYRLFYDQPLHLVRGEGCTTPRALSGRLNNVVPLGHCHPPWSRRSRGRPRP